MRNDDHSLSASELTELLSQDLIGSIDLAERPRADALWALATPEASIAVRRDIDVLAQGIVAMLPTDACAPSADHRERVVNAVMSAGSLAGSHGEGIDFDEERIDEELGVVAKIGMTAQAAPGWVVAPAQPTESISELTADDSLRLIPSRRVSRFWRAAALASASAAAILAIATIDVQNQVSQIEQLMARDSFISDLGSLLGGSLRNSLFDENVSHVLLTSPTSQSVAVLLVNPLDGRGHLVFENADKTDGRRLAVVLIDDTHSKITQLETISALAGLNSVPLDNLSIQPGQRLAIYDFASGKELLTTRTLDFLLA